MIQGRIDEREEELEELEKLDDEKTNQKYYRMILYLT